VSLVKASVEEIKGNSKINIEINGKKEAFSNKINSHDEALNFLLNEILNRKVISSLEEINAIGHRIVHGGEKFNSAVVIDGDVIKGIEDCVVLAPLHNPANLEGINACKKILPSKINVAVFDTAFHQTMPKEAFLYPLPYEYYEKYKIRKYGFHGSSHKFVAQRAAQILGQPLSDLNIITCHLGNGSSITAIKNGKSYNTTMGFTPLAGLMMGTRSGDIDPAIIPYLMKKENLSVNQIDEILNKKSGLLGLSGISSDCRDIEDEAWNKGNERAKIALDKLSFRIKESLGSYLALLAGIDAIVFTGGLGEKSPETREFVCSNLEHLGIIIDRDKNKFKGQEREISAPDSKIKVFVIPTNEELMIARETNQIIGADV
jgi:acetate kinase